MTTGISGAALLRTLADDVPDMAVTVREHLREIADAIEFGQKTGTLRCRRCGEMAEVTITMARLPMTPNAEFTGGPPGPSGGMPGSAHTEE